MAYRAYAEIDLGAIASNVAVIKSSTSADVLAVVKADAYGHGLIPVAQTALASGASWLGVALLEEAIALRKAGIDARTIAWLTPPGDDFVSAIKHDIDLSVSSVVLLKEILAAGASVGRTPRIHIEVDTGMRRGGFLDEWKLFLEELAKNGDELHVVGLWTHFARADEPEDPATSNQVQEFEKYHADLKAVGINPQIIHLSNSAATLSAPSTHRSMVRLGIAMYGLSPDVKTLGDASTYSLKPAMTLKAKLSLVKEAPKGSAVGYGGTAILNEDTKLGIVVLGYSDGIPRNTSANAGVSFNGKKAPIVGRVSMDQFVVNLGSDSPALSGDYVTVFGGIPEEEGYSIDEWAAAASTINYEIVTRIASRVPRIYVN
jgi:alanine racemase